MHNTLALASALKPQATDPVEAAARLERDLQNAQRLNRRIALLAARRKEPAETKRANRSTLDEIAASLGVSRSTMNRILEEPPVRGGGKRLEHKDGAGKHHRRGRRHAGVESGTRGNLRRQSARRAYLAWAASS